MDGTITKYVQLTLCCAVERKKKKIFEIKKEIFEWWVEWTFRFSHSELQPVGNSRVFPLVWGTLGMSVCNSAPQCFMKPLEITHLEIIENIFHWEKCSTLLLFSLLKVPLDLLLVQHPTLISSAAAVVYTFHFFLLFIFLWVFLLRGAINSYFLLLLQLVELIDFKLQTLPKNALDLSIWRWMCNPATPYCMILFLHGWVVNFNLLQDVSFFAFIVSCQCVFILYSLSSQPLSRARNGWWI